MKKINSLPPERWAEYKKIKLDSIKNEPLAFSESYEKLSGKSDDDWEKELLNQDKDNTILVFIENEGSLVAFANGHVHENIRLSHNAFLSNLYVYPEFRSKGLGTDLVDERIKIIQEKYLDWKVPLSLHTL